MLVNIFHHEGEKLRIHHFGDAHMGSQNSAVNALIEEMAKARKDRIGVLQTMGDMCDGITPRDKRYDYRNIDPELNTLEKQFDLLEELVKPWAKKDRVLGMHFSNHYGRLVKETTMNELKRIADRLQVPYLGYTAFTKILMKSGKKKRTFMLWSSHGWGGGEWPGAKVNRLNRLLLKYDADVYVQGHTHQLLSINLARLRLDGRNRVKAQPIICGYSGSWYRTYGHNIDGSYAEERQYMPLAIGHLVTEFNIDGGMHQECVVWEDL